MAIIATDRKISNSAATDITCRKQAIRQMTNAPYTYRKIFLYDSQVTAIYGATPSKLLLIATANFRI